MELALVLNLTYILVGFLPIFGLLLQHVRLNGKKWFLLFSSTFIPSMVVMYLLTPLYDPLSPFYPMKFLIPIYGLFLMATLTGFVWKHGFMEFNKFLGITFLLVYVATEYWQIPVFVFGYLGLFGKYFTGVVNQAYLLVAFVLLVKFTNLRFTNVNMGLLVFPLVVSTIIQILYPCTIHSGSTWMISRFVNCFCLGGVFLR